MIRTINLPFFNSKVIMTFHQMVQNPTGKHSAYMGSRERIIADLEARYHKILIKAKNKINFKIFKDNDDYIFYFKIPSETYDKLMYDVVIHFSPVNKEDINSNSINDYGVKVFSNSPAFTFTYTFVMNINGLLVDFLKKTKCSNPALTQAPKLRNPVEQYGFEKSIYYAALFIREHKLTVKGNIDRMTNKLDVNYLLSEIKTDMDKIQEYNQHKNSVVLMRAKKRKEKAKKVKEVAAKNKIKKARPITKVAKTREEE